MTESGQIYLSSKFLFEFIRKLNKSKAQCLPKPDQNINVACFFWVSLGKGAVQDQFFNTVFFFRVGISLLRTAITCSRESSAFLFASFAILIFYLTKNFT